MHSPSPASQRCKATLARLRAASERSWLLRRCASAIHVGATLALSALLLASSARDAHARAASTHAASVPPEPSRDALLRGEVVETGCFVIGGRHGEGHRHCAQSCARAGENLGILDEQTKLLYVVVQDLTASAQPNPLLPFVADRVEVRGTTVERGGVNGIVVRQVKSLMPPPAAH